MLCRRVAQWLIGGGSSLIVLGLGTGVASAEPLPTPPPVPPPGVVIAPDPYPIDQGGRVILHDTVGAACNNAGVICT